MGEPPFDAGVLKETRAWASPAEAEAPVGTPGAAQAVVGKETIDPKPVPAGLVS